MTDPEVVDGSTLLSDDGTILLTIGTEILTLYDLTSPDSTIIQTIQKTGETFQSIDITSDKQFVVVSGSLNNYVFENNVGTYEEKQVIETVNELATFGIAISDDHQILVTGKNSGTVTVYSYDSNIFIEDYNLTDATTKVESLSMTSDKLFLIVGATEINSYLYKLNSNTSQFELFQTIVHDSSDTHFVDMTDDHQFLVISAVTELSLYIYKYDGNQFQLL